jgi:FtsZ-binding cell division protein ZapB
MAKFPAKWPPATDVEEWLAKSRVSNDFDWEAEIFKRDMIKILHNSKRNHVDDLEAKLSKEIDNAVDTMSRAIEEINRLKKENEMLRAEANNNYRLFELEQARRLQCIGPGGSLYTESK